MSLNVTQYLSPELLGQLLRQHRDFEVTEIEGLQVSVSRRPENANWYVYLDGKEAESFLSEGRGNLAAPKPYPDLVQALCVASSPKLRSRVLEKLANDQRALWAGAAEDER